VTGNQTQNNLVDSLEFISSFALLSGMTPEDKFHCMRITNVIG